MISIRNHHFLEKIDFIASEFIYLADFLLVNFVFIAELKKCVFLWIDWMNDKLFSISHCSYFTFENTAVFFDYFESALGVYLGESDYGGEKVSTRLAFDGELE